MQELLALVADHQWVAASALVVGFTVRILKTDTKIPINIPARVRPWLALSLGAGAGILERVQSGISWRDALAGGLVAGLTAIAGHDTLIEGIRKGRELPLPGLTGGKPPTSIMLVLLALLTFGCTGSFEAARGPSVKLGAAPALQERCEALDTKHRRASATAKAGAIVAGGTGVAAIPLDSREAQIALASTAVVGAIVAGSSLVIADKSSESWARQCAQ